MKRIPFQYIFLTFIFEVICSGSEVPGRSSWEAVQDTLQEKQFIYNGRIWKNTYSRIRGDAYFLTGEFMNGTVVFNDKSYYNLKIKYDIFLDEVILYINPKTIIILNKEMTDRFSFEHEGNKYNIVNLGRDTSGMVDGYVNLLYDGPTSFYVKYIKKIEPLAEERRYDRFSEMHRMYLRQDSLLVNFSSKQGLFRILGNRKDELKDFIKKNRLKITRKEPYTFIPLFEFYDSLPENEPELK